MDAPALLQKCCLIGESVIGNPTHFMVEQAFAAAGIDWRFLTFEVKATRLVDALRGVSALGFDGALLLPSLQRPSWEHVPGHTDRANQTHSVSCLIERDGRLIGDDLAGHSVTEAMLSTHPLAGRHALLLGTAGRGLSAANAMLQQGVASLRVVEYGEEADAELTSRLADQYPDQHVEGLEPDGDLLDLPTEVNLFFSASCWHKEQDEPAARLLAPHFRQDCVVGDARVRSGHSPLLREAAERGAHTVEGVEILAYEVREALRLWTGVLPPIGVLLDAAEEFLGV